MEVTKTTYDLFNEFFQKEYSDTLENLIGRFNDFGFKTLDINIGIGFFNIYSVGGFEYNSETGASDYKKRNFHIGFRAYKDLFARFNFDKIYPMTERGFKNAARYIDRKRVEFATQITEKILTGEVKRP